MAAGRITAGRPEPLGVVPTATGVNVAVFSSGATAIDLCLFDAEGVETRIRLPDRTGDVFHGHVEGVRECDAYGLRAHGPWRPESGQRFDASKLLVDPFAVAIDRRFELHPSHFAAPDQMADSGPHTPKALVTAPVAPARPALIHPWADTIIYEAHVRGLTARHPAVPEQARGTFAGLAHPAVIEHLTRLGVTTLELLPVAAWVDERHLPPLGLSNYWGYNPIALCAPDPRLAPGGWAEIRAAVQALADAGIETILDVVYNHTGESDELGPTLSLRGLDNAGYYRLNLDDPALYINDAGTGNILACDRPAVVRLIMEAMRTWARRAGVAGFRFDLASVLGRRTDGFDPAAPLLAAIDQDPELRELKLIAEPWDCGPGGYQLGRFPAAWGEWNDRYRAGVRRFWRGEGSLGDLAGRLAGSQDAFATRHRPSRSINFVTAHDGFTLADLVSHEHKHNDANGEANRDGDDHNLSWNNGVEGPTDDPMILARRQADQRALLALLLVSRGTPMISMGAELGHSQGGNNNAYAQDNALSWIDWSAADTGLTAFTARLCAARRSHPALRVDRFLTGEPVDSAWPDVTWARADGSPLFPHDWDEPGGPALQMILTAATDDDGVNRVAVLLNRGDASLAFRLPDARSGHAWRQIADSAAPGHSTGAASAELGARAVSLWAEEALPGAARTASDGAVHDLARAAGISDEWWSVAGDRREVSLDTKRALLASMGFEARTPDDVAEGLWRLGAERRAALPACKVTAERQPIIVSVRGPEAWLSLAGPGVRPQAFPVIDGAARLPPLSPGRYRLQLGDHEGALIVTPARAYEPPRLARGERIFGLSAQLYALKRHGDGGIGDFTTLAQLGDLAARNGAALVAINPLHALFPGARDRASPYYPSDRRFLEPLYLDLPGAAAAHPADGSALIDYPAVWAAKAARLSAAVREAVDARPAAFAAFQSAGGKTLADYCLFEAIAETQPGISWQAWPAGLRNPETAEARAFAAAHADALTRHAAIQWLCDEQLASAAAHAPGLGICRDLAIGAAPDGAETWAAGARMASGVSIGAPPDAFAAEGQVWGLPPPNPHRMRADAYRPFAELLAANMRHAGALRIDHVLGLSRLFWVPEGAEGRDGAYVAYPQDDLLAVLALESHQSRCLVIGEDLGTVPEGFREALSDRGVYSYSVLPFERDGAAFRSPATYPAQALACVSTHDLPPLAGWWDGVDLAEREQLGLLRGGDLAQAHEERQADKAALLDVLATAGRLEPTLPDAPFSPDIAAAIHAFVAAGESKIFLAQIEDLAGERTSINLPGTDRERPNWRRRVQRDVSTLDDAPLARALIVEISTVRPSTSVL